MIIKCWGIILKISRIFLKEKWRFIKYYTKTRSRMINPDCPKRRSLFPLVPERPWPGNAGNWFYFWKLNIHDKRNSSSHNKRLRSIWTTFTWRYCQAGDWHNYQDVRWDLYAQWSCTKTSRTSFCPSNRYLVCRYLPQPMPPSQFPKIRVRNKGPFINYVRVPSGGGGWKNL